MCVCWREEGAPWKRVGLYGGVERGGEEEGLRIWGEFKEPDLALLGVLDSAFCSSWLCPPRL